MKKTLTFLSLMGAMATSAVAGTVAIAPAPAPAPVPAWEPAVGVEALCASGDENGIPNLWGPRFSFSLTKAANDVVSHELNAGIAFLWGSECSYGTNFRAFQMPMTVGYNFNYALTDKLSAYVGAKVGLNLFNVNFREEDEEYIYKYGETAWGWQWAVGAGLKYELTQQMDLVLGYEFTRVYSDFDFGDTALGWHVINLGVIYSF